MDKHLSMTQMQSSFGILTLCDDVVNNIRRMTTHNVHGGRPRNLVSKDVWTMTDHKILPSYWRGISRRVLRHLADMPNPL